MSVKTLAEILRETTEYYETHGFSDQSRLEEWIKEIEDAISAHMNSMQYITKIMQEQMRAIFDRLVYKGAAIKMHPGIDRFTIKNIAPRLHGELDRRILASANLIKLNREQMIAKTLQRFQGWATSIPKGGSENVDKKQVRDEIIKPMKSLPFLERRVLTDQGHKLTASINQTIAVDGGAIACIWFSHFRQPGYDYREDHKDRDGKIYLIRGSWAHKDGLVKVGPNGYSDQITQPGEEVYCRCRFQYVYHLRQLPDDMVTIKGRETLAKVRSA